jgi:hypothetical protein
MQQHLFGSNEACYANMHDYVYIQFMGVPDSRRRMTSSCQSQAHRLAGVSLSTVMALV